MRITNSVMQRNAVRNLQSGLQRLTNAQIQASSLKRYETFADDPQAQSSIMRSSGTLRAIEQYRRNINDAQARASLEDSVLGQVSTILDRVKELAVQQASDTATASTRLGTKAEVDNLIASLVSLGNTTYAGAYLFGGTDASTPPLTTEPPFYSGDAPPTGAPQTEVAEGQLFTTNHTATELFLDTNLLQTLHDLSTALGANSMDGISASIANIDSATQGIQTFVGDIGARINRLDVASSNLDLLKQNLTTYTANLAEVDAAQAYTNFSIQQSAYESAMLATTRVLSLSLTDYLK